MEKFLTLIEKSHRVSVYVCGCGTETSACDSIRIAAEVFYVVCDPFECQLLIEERDVSWGQASEIGESENLLAVVEAYGDDIGDGDKGSQVKVEGATRVWRSAVKDNDNLGEN